MVVIADKLRFYVMVLFILHSSFWSMMSRMTFILLNSLAPIILA